jgi:putative colanic acid biosynthesis glycosyltransferase
MRAPYYSIITITKNNLAGLEDTAHSIALQTHDQWRDYEWIVIDGHSEDATDAFLKQTNKSGINVNWISEPDSGLYDAMNKGIERSNGVYIIFMNAGDTFCDDNILERIQNEIDEPLPDLIYGDALEENESGAQYYKTARHHRLIHKGLFTHHQSMFYKRDKIEKMRFDLNYSYAADYDFTARFLKNNPYAHYIDQPICIFEGGGRSQKNASKSRKEEFQIRKSLNVPLYKNMITMLRQTSAQLLRQISAPLYWKIRESF